MLHEMVWQDALDGDTQRGCEIRPIHTNEAVANKQVLHKRPRFRRRENGPSSKTQSNPIACSYPISTKAGNTVGCVNNPTLSRIQRVAKVRDKRSLYVGRHLCKVLDQLGPLLGPCAFHERHLVGLFAVSRCGVLIKYATKTST